MDVPDPSLLDGSVVFVMGGSGGIGRGIADVLAASGCKVVVFSRSPPRPGPGGRPPPLKWVHLDLRVPAMVTASIEKALAECDGRLDAVFYSAVSYGARRAPVSEVPEEEWREQIDVNLHGLWLTLRATLPALERRPPSLFVGVSSEVVINGGPGRSGYAASKAGAASLLNSLSQEIDGSAVRVVQIMPEGMVDTPGIRRRRPDGFDYTGYMDPGIFGHATRSLVATRGLGLHGTALVVDSRGRLYSASSEPPVSQSRR